MRDAIHIGLLALVFAFLATRFPSSLPSAPAVATAPAFASFITLSPAAHSAWLESARTSWQVRNQARSRPSIGRLDADIPLLAEILPPIQPVVFRHPKQAAADIPMSDGDTYSFLPPSGGADMAEFSAPPRAKDADVPARQGEPAKPAFDRKSMVSFEQSRILKEIMQ